MIKLILYLLFIVFRIPCGERYNVVYPSVPRGFDEVKVQPETLENYMDYVCQTNRSPNIKYSVFFSITGNGFKCEK